MYCVYDKMQLPNSCRTPALLNWNLLDNQIIYTKQMYISAVVTLVALSVVLVIAEKDICCMPRGHKVSVRDTSTTIKNCTSSGCSTINTLIMNYIHYPDLDNYRYRLDFKGEAGQGPFFEGTTLGFITNKTSLLGY